MSFYKWKFKNNLFHTIVHELKLKFSILSWRLFSAPLKTFTSAQDLCAIVRRLKDPHTCGKRLSSFHMRRRIKMLRNFGAIGVAVLPAIFVAGCDAHTPQKDMFCWVEQHQLVFNMDKWGEAPPLDCTPVTLLKATEITDLGAGAVAGGRGAAGTGTGETGSSASSGGGGSAASSGTGGAAASAGGGGASAAGGGSAAAAGDGGAAAAGGGAAAAAGGGSASASSGGASASAGGGSASASSTD